MHARPFSDTFSRFLHLAAVAALILAAACGTPTQPDIDFGRPIPDADSLLTVEAIPFEALRGGRIAFWRRYVTGSHGQGIITVDGATRTTGRHLTGMPWGDPVISPDGTRVAYRALMSITTFWDVLVINLDGTGFRQISSSEGNGEGPPRWTPDGTRILYPDSKSLVGTVVRSRSASATGLTDSLLALPQDSTRFWASWDLVLDVNAAGVVAFPGHAGTQSRGISLWESGATAPRRVYVPSLEPLASVWAPAWSPDGRALAFLETSVGANGGQETRLMILDMATESARRLSAVTLPPVQKQANFGDHTSYSACWTRNGAAVVFTAPTGLTSDGLLQFRVFAVPAEGGETVRLTSATDAVDISVGCW